MTTPKDRPDMGAIEVITSVQRRRRWSACRFSDWFTPPFSESFTPLYPGLRDRM